MTLTTVKFQGTSWISRLKFHSGCLSRSPKMTWWLCLPGSFRRDIVVFVLVKILHYTKNKLDIHTHTSNFLLTWSPRSFYWVVSDISSFHSFWGRWTHFDEHIFQRGASTTNQLTIDTLGCRALTFQLSAGQVTFSSSPVPLCAGGVGWSLKICFRKFQCLWFIVTL